MRFSITLIAVLGLAACAPLRWQRANTDAATVSADTEACMVQGRERLARMVGPLGPARLDPKFGPDVSQPSAAERRIREQELAERCMRDKGYRLVPDA